MLIFYDSFSQDMSATTLKEGKFVSYTAGWIFLLLGVSFPLHVCHKL